MLESNQIYQGDCLEIMEQIDDQSIDMILCDLPYGQTAPLWDSCIDMVAVWRQYNRIVKKCNTVVLFAAQPYTSRVILSNEENFRYCWYWIKNQGTNFFHANRMPIRKVEEICVFNKGRYSPQITGGHVPTNSAKGVSKGKAYSGVNVRNSSGGKVTRLPSNILEFKCVNNYLRYHSAEKPVDLCEYLISTYTEPGDLVLDNCIGSGTTALAAQKIGRNFIGIEKESKYVEIANHRIREARR